MGSREKSPARVPWPSPLSVPGQFCLTGFLLTLPTLPPPSPYPPHPCRAAPGLVCLACFLFATCFTLQSGNYWLEIFDNVAASLNLLILAFLEVVGVAYVYGMKR